MAKGNPNTSSGKLLSDPATAAPQAAAEAAGAEAPEAVPRKVARAATAANPVEALGVFFAENSSHNKVFIGYSGGLDSHVLLHAAHLALKLYFPDRFGAPTDDSQTSSAESGGTSQYELSAIHVNHGLQAVSKSWVEHCRRQCDALGIELNVCHAKVAESGDGPEAAARRARYEQFASVLEHGDLLLLAQHADDQAETFLLQALRGSGPDGLASIPKKRPFSRGFLCRPLLGLMRTDLERYASENDLQTITDPSNTDTRFDRNYLRHEIMPLLRKRWPAVAKTLSRAALRSGAASGLLLKLAARDLRQVSLNPDTARSSGKGATAAALQPGNSPGQLELDDTAYRLGEVTQLDVVGLRELGQERLYNALRLWVRRAGYRMPRLGDLQHIDTDLLNNKAETGGVVKTREYEFRRYRNRLFLLDPHRTNAANYQYEWTEPFLDLHIGEIGLTLCADECVLQGLCLPVGSTVSVRSRKGGELIRLGPPAIHKSVKKLLQEADIPPWERDAVPLLYVDDKLAAVWKVAVAADFQR